MSAEDAAVVRARALNEAAYEHWNKKRSADALVAYAAALELSGARLDGRLGDQLAWAEAQIGSPVSAVIGADIERFSVDASHLDVPAEVDQNVARALIGIGLVLDQLDRHDVEIDAWDEVISRFEENHDPEICRRVARALYYKGLALTQVDRPEDAIVTFDAVIARFGPAEDLSLKERVGWALYKKATVLRDLGRTEEAVESFDVLIGSFGDEQAPVLRERVSWALWRTSSLLADLGRVADQEAVYRLLASRGDERVDSDLAEEIAWCLSHQAHASRVSERHEDALLILQELIDRFSGFSEEKVQSQVARAYMGRAFHLAKLGRHEEIVSEYQRMLEQFANRPQPAERCEAIVECLIYEARLLEDLERGPEAVSAFNDALALLGVSEHPSLTRRHVDVLIKKGRLLTRLDRPEEARIAFAAAVTLPLDTVAHAGEGRIFAAGLVGLFDAVDRLSKLDPDSVATIPDRLAGLLGDVTDDLAASEPAEDSSLTDEEIAAVLAELLDGGCWQQFATSGDDPATLSAMTRRALELYELTEPLITGAGDSHPEAAMAASMIRNVAGGYALLSRGWTAQEREGLSLPSDLLLSSQIRRLQLDDWAAEHGHPLELSDTEDLENDLIASEHERSEAFEPNLAGGLLGSAHQLQMLRTLRKSRRGRDALVQISLQEYAAERINDARGTAGWTWQQQIEAAGVAAARVYIAEAFFVSTHSTRLPGELFPEPSFLREILADSEAYDWLELEDVELPGWLSPPPD